MSDRGQTRTEREVPAPVLEAYGLAGSVTELIPGGLINSTFVVRDRAGGACAVAQRLHEIFAPEVNLDIEVVTDHLAARGMATPRLIRSREGDRWVEIDGQIWRMLTYVEGTTIHQVRGPADAEAAGELAGRFHRAVADLTHEFLFVRAGVHDTPRHLNRLQRAVSSDATPVLAGAVELGKEILDLASSLAPLSDLPRRCVHGDMKISNVRFATGEVGRAHCWLDFDTLGRQLIAYELGDALRSWCNPHGEDTPTPELDMEVFRAAIRGYASSIGDLLSAAEIADILPGLETVCVELAARFCVDVFDDSYFGWDPRRYPNRREHNLVRARGQLSLARSVAAQSKPAAAIVVDLLGLQ